MRICGTRRKSYTIMHVYRFLIQNTRELQLKSIFHFRRNGKLHVTTFTQIKLHRIKKHGCFKTISINILVKCHYRRKSLNVNFFSSRINAQQCRIDIDRNLSENHSLCFDQNDLFESDSMMLKFEASVRWVEFMTGSSYPHKKQSLLGFFITKSLMHVKISMPQT